MARKKKLTELQALKAEVRELREYLERLTVHYNAPPLDGLLWLSAGLYGGHGSTTTAQPSLTSWE